MIMVMMMMQLVTGDFLRFSSKWILSIIRSFSRLPNHSHHYDHNIHPHHHQLVLGAPYFSFPPWSLKHCSHWNLFLKINLSLYLNLSSQVQLSCHGLGEAPLVGRHHLSSDEKQFVSGSFKSDTIFVVHILDFSLTMCLTWKDFHLHFSNQIKDLLFLSLFCQFSNQTKHLLF